MIPDEAVEAESEPEVIALAIVADLREWGRKVSGK